MALNVNNGLDVKGNIDLNSGNISGSNIVSAELFKTDGVVISGSEVIGATIKSTTIISDNIQTNNSFSGVISGGTISIPNGDITTLNSTNLTSDNATISELTATNITLSGGTISGAGIISTDLLFVNGQTFTSLANFGDETGGTGGKIGNVDDNVASGEFSVAEGDKTTAIGDQAHAEGALTTAEGFNSHAEGWQTHAEGWHSHAEGRQTTTFYAGSHAEGRETTAYGYYSHAEGYKTTAQDDASHAEGKLTIAEGNYSHAEGFKTTAKGDSSHAGGYNAIAKDNNTFVWSDGTQFASQGASTFNIHATSGVHISGGSLFINGQDVSTIIDLSAVNQSIVPDTSGAYDLGSTIAPWATLYTNNISSTGNISGASFYGDASNLINLPVVTTSVDGLSGGEIIGDIIPSISGVYSLGSASKPWKDLFVSGSSIYIGDSVISSPSSGNLEIDGQPLVTQSVLQTAVDTFPTEVILSLSGGASYATDIGDNASTNFTVTHNLNDTDVVVSVKDNGTGELVTPYVRIEDANSIYVSFSITPTTDQFSVTVLASDFSTIISNGLINSVEGLSGGNILSDVSVTGNISGSAFFGDGSGLTGIASGSVTTNVDGLSGGEIIGDLSVTGNISGSAFFGDGSALTGIVSLSNVVDEISGSANGVRLGDVTNNIATGYLSIAEGNQTKALGGQSHAEGLDTTAKGDSSHAEGYKTIAYGWHSHAEGYKTSALTNNAHSEGSSTIANGQDAHAEGTSTKAYSSAHSEGMQTTAQGTTSHAEGFNTSAFGGSSHSEGHSTKAIGDNSHASGHNAIATNNNSFVWSDGATFASQGTQTFNVHATNGVYISGGSLVVAGNISGGVLHGDGSNLTGIDTGSVTTSVDGLSGGEVIGDIIPSVSGAFDLGSITKPWKDLYLTENSIYLGGTQISVSGGELLVNGSGATSNVGSDISTTGDISGSNLYGTNIYGTTISAVNISGAYIFGDGSNLTGLSLDAFTDEISGSANGARIGNVVNNVATGNFAIAEGSYTTSSGFATHSEGAVSYAKGDYSHAEGVNTSSFGEASHAEGSFTTAIGDYTHSEGGGTTAIGHFSHTEGRSTTAIGNESHASGYQSIALHDRSFVWSDGKEVVSKGIGTFNIHASGGVHISGGGLFVNGQEIISGGELNFDGNVDFNANLEVGGNAQIDGNLGVTGNISGALLFGDGANLLNVNNLFNVVDDDTGVRIGDTATNDVVGNYGIASGRNATAQHNDSFVWSDGTIASSQGDSTFTINASGGTYVYGNLQVANGDLNVTNVNANEILTTGNISGSAFYGDGSNLTNVPSTLTEVDGLSGGSLVGDLSLTGNISGAYIYGDGSNLTNVVLQNVADDATGGAKIGQLTSLSANGSNSIAMGEGAQANDDNSFVWSDGTNFASQGVGTFNIHATSGVHLSGGNFTVNGNQVAFVGYGSAGSNLFDEGTGTRIGDKDNNVASGDYTVAEGKHTSAIGNMSHTEGAYTTAFGWHSHAEGYQTTAVGLNSHSEGRDTIAYGLGSHAEGRETTAYGVYSHAGGRNAKATHANSFVWSSGQSIESQGIGTFNVFASGGIHLSGGPLTLDGQVVSEFRSVENSVIGMTQVVDSFPTTKSDGAEFIVTAKNGANYKIIKILAIWDGTTLNYSTVGTQSIGNTTDIVLEVYINTGNVILLSTSTLSWDLKVKRLNI